MRAVPYHGIPMDMYVNVAYDNFNYKRRYDAEDKWTSVAASRHVEVCKQEQQTATVYTTWPRRRHARLPSDGVRTCWYRRLIPSLGRLEGRKNADNVRVRTRFVLSNCFELEDYAVSQTLLSFILLQQITICYSSPDSSCSDCLRGFSQYVSDFHICRFLFNSQNMLRQLLDEHACRDNCCHWRKSSAVVGIVSTCGRISQI